MSQADQMNALQNNFTKASPSIANVVTEGRINFVKSFDPSAAIQVGDNFPEFSLSDAVGHQRSSSELLSKGPLLIAFYRGEWCPFCNIALVNFQKILPDIQAKGITFAAISPELPNHSLSATEKHDLKFPVLSDVGNQLAKKLGIVWYQPDSLRTIYKQIGNDLKERNGDDSFAVPVPATFLIGKDGKVKRSFINPDYTIRVEPKEVLKWLDELKN